MWTYYPCLLSSSVLICLSPGLLCIFSLVFELGKRVPYWRSVAFSLILSTQWQLNVLWNQRPCKNCKQNLGWGQQWQEIHDYLKSLCGDVHITRGEYDDDSRYPETKQLTIGAFKLGICHGHQVQPICSSLSFLLHTRICWYWQGKTICLDWFSQKFWFCCDQV